MKLPKKEKPAKKFIGIGAAVAAVLLVGAGVWYLWFYSKAPEAALQSDTVNYGPPTEEEKQATEQQKEQIIKNQENPPTLATEIHVVIVRTFQDPSGFNIRTEVGGTTSGDCEVRLSKSGQSDIVKTFPVVFEATTTTCQSTPIPASEFPSGGEWNVSVIIKKSSTQSTPATATVTITK